MSVKGEIESVADGDLKYFRFVHTVDARYSIGIG